MVVFCKPLLKILFFLVIPSTWAAVCDTEECRDIASRIKNSLDPKVDPCDDFYKFTCGKYPGSPLQTMKNSEDINAQSLDIVKNLLKKLFEDSSGSQDDLEIFKFIRTAYKQCMNENNIEKQGLDPLKKLLSAIGGWPVVEGNKWNEKDFNWVKSAHKFRTNGLVGGYFFKIDLDADLNNKHQYAVHIHPPDHEITLNDVSDGSNSTRLKEYLKYMIDVAVVLGAKEDKAQKELEAVIKFESDLIKARNQIPNSESITLAELHKNFSTIPWINYLNGILQPGPKYDGNSSVYVYNMQYIKSFEEILNKTSKKTLANYAGWRAVNELTPTLVKKIRDATAEFKNQSADSRSIQCIDLLMQYLKTGVNAMYIRKHFKEEMKNDISEMYYYIRTIFLSDLEKVEYLDKETKDAIHQKLNQTLTLLGYPNQLMDDNSVEKYYQNLNRNSDSILSTILNAQLHYMNQMVRNMMTKLDDSAWLQLTRFVLVPGTFLSYLNELAITAAYFQSKCYEKNRPDYVNYALCGSDIGPLISGQFDEYGRQFDANGTLRNWWTEEAEKPFLENIKCFKDQLNAYNLEKYNLNISSDAALNTYLWINGGVKTAYSAYEKLSKTEKSLPGFEKYSPKQLFWIIFGNSFCSVEKNTKKSVEAKGWSEEYRGMGALKNSPEFSADFECSTDSNMNPVDKCKIW